MSIRIGENIRKLRKEKGITQEILADHLAVTPQAISRWESGAGYPGIDYLPDLAGFFGISVDELLGVKLSEREARREHFYQAIDRMKTGRIRSTVTTSLLSISCGKRTRSFRETGRSGLHWPGPFSVHGGKAGRTRRTSRKRRFSCGT